uniref:Uncharacterized protein n=1 Tax=Mantoniella antarctica TaxID=81844 RepID=A0A7S0T2Y4_9CHLO
MSSELKFLCNYVWKRRRRGWWSCVLCLQAYKLVDLIREYALKVQCSCKVFDNNTGLELNLTVVEKSTFFKSPLSTAHGVQVCCCNSKVKIYFIVWKHTAAQEFNVVHRNVFKVSCNYPSNVLIQFSRSVINCHTSINIKSSLCLGNYRRVGNV